jgi:hypothetical protein
MQRLLLFLSIGLSAVVTGCATAAKPLVEILPGFYTMTAGGFNESLTIELKQDFTYTMDHELFACVVGPNGEMPITYSREEGSWKFEGGVVTLEAKARTKDFPDARVFAPAAFRRLQPKQNGKDLYLVHPEFPTQYVLQKGRQNDSLFTRKKE